MVPMNEIDRMRYLQAMGVDSYVSRRQLPGAAPTRRLALVRSSQLPAASNEARPQAHAEAPQMPRVDRVTAKLVPKSQPVATPKPASPAVRFNLVAVFTGGIAWVESLDDRPLATEQVQLIRGMARAVHGEASNPRVAQFDWPITNNPQLDQGVEAAKAGVSAFLQRHIEEQKCRALVILGANCSALVPTAQLGGINHVTTCSTLEMLEKPGSKKQVWADLQSLVLRA